VLGKTWNWAEENHTFIGDRKEIQQSLRDAKVLYRKGA
jgi:hypothetical protein